MTIEDRQRGIIGIGTDVMTLERFSRTLSRFRERFLMKVFTDQEMTYCLSLSQKQSVLSLSARFCVKEATFKALQLRIGSHGFGFKDVFVQKSSLGVPQLCFSKSLSRWSKKRGVMRKHVSISHCHQMAQAFVVLES